MPFQSAKQERWMFANKPEMAKDWAKKYGNAPGMTHSKTKAKSMRDRMFEALKK